MHQCRSVSLSKLQVLKGAYGGDKAISRLGTLLYFSSMPQEVLSQDMSDCNIIAEQH